MNLQTSKTKIKMMVFLTVMGLTSSSSSSASRSLLRSSRSSRSSRLSSDGSDSSESSVSSNSSVLRSGSSLSSSSSASESASVSASVPAAAPGSSLGSSDSSLEAMMLDSSSSLSSSTSLSTAPPLTSRTLRSSSSGSWTVGPPSESTYSPYTSITPSTPSSTSSSSNEDKRRDGRTNRQDRPTNLRQFDNDSYDNNDSTLLFLDTESVYFPTSDTDSQSSQSSQTNSQSSQSTQLNLQSNGCPPNKIKVTIQTQADKYSNDTSWDLMHPNGIKILHEVPKSYAPYEQKSSSVCLAKGMYNLTFYDSYGDGFCCRYGEGYYKVLFHPPNGKNGEEREEYEVLRGGSFNKLDSTLLHVGYDPSDEMSIREFQYLESHNVRRKKWHERYNTTYVPLRYSPALARESQRWAEKLLDSCNQPGIEHEEHVAEGENLAKNIGKNGWGRLYPVDNIVARWIDWEEGWPYPSNGHLTQALWRSSKYLGCGESKRVLRGKGSDGGRRVCRIQVCRYARAGNCDMARYNATVGENWLGPMLDGYTRCGPSCPKEGCF